MPSIAAKDGTRIHYQDWGSGPAVLFSHGWPLNGDAWAEQMVAVASQGFRAIAHDRRGHGRSDRPWDGNDIDTYADDLDSVIEHLNLRDASLVGHSTGGGEVTRYAGRHGTGRIARMVLLGAVPPQMVKSPTNPDGLPMEAFDSIRAGVLKDRSQFYRDLSGPFFGANRPGAEVSAGLRDAFWLMSMQAGLKGVHDCVRAFSETDFTEDLKRIDKPVLVIHGDDDQIVPIGISGQASSRILQKAELKVYEGAPHGLAATHAARFNRDLLAFLRA